MAKKIVEETKVEVEPTPAPEVFVEEEFDPLAEVLEVPMWDKVKAFVDKYKLWIAGACAILALAWFFN